MGLPLPRRCCNCGDPVTMPYLGGHGRAAAAVGGEQRPSWASHLAAADFSKPCSRDRVCDTCGGAAFCAHCCEEHHRGHVTCPAPTKDDATDHRRDSFCIGCRVAFCSELCAHHGVGHEVIPVDEYEGWQCARCTGSERWFPVFAGVQTFQDNEGNLLVPLHRKPAAVPKPVEDGPCPPPWMFELVTADFAKTCARDRVCNTCVGAAFCGHCCGEHHSGHDTTASIPEEKDGPEATVVHRRDSFCTGCRVAFCSDLCAHHASGVGHEVIAVNKFVEWHCVRCTGSEWWFPALHYMLMLAFVDEHGNLFVPFQWNGEVEDGEELPWWMTHLGTADFSKTCTRDRVCNTCGGAGFCEHCCGEHHRGHETSAAATDETEGSVAPAGYRRDSFCIGCGLAFCSELCAHHAGGDGHEVIPVDVYGDRHFLRCTGSEPWFASAFGDIETYEDKDGNLMVPGERKRSMIPESGLRYATRHCGGTTVPPAAANPFDF
ncbi:hypothetical protein CFC21_006026 [Triticum aestivum]|uniref:C2H2-type domain-containing protein n=2 Tax=Triticum aestivum TaxID=4565 RepID=A0A9R1DAX2_WHEAT|nr:uncharacterized protein LOC123089079 [Triticum aestivum]KAF6988501.1 hypothetical protein CFC21_006026 [Triticum aestivum]